MTYDLIIIGGGASGLAAACAAANVGAGILVIEKNHVPGRKILSTGAGKCNFSNFQISPDHYHIHNPAFLEQTFKALSPAEIPAFFEKLGLLCTRGENGRLFPRSMKAQDVVGVLVNRLGVLGVTLLTLTEVTAIRKEKDGFLVETFAVAPRWEKKAAESVKKNYSAKRVILAAGGATYPQIGGSLKGYALLESFGHSVSAPRPALVPLKIKEKIVKNLDGVRLEARLSLTDGKDKLAETAGELLFTGYGISGPATLDLSRAALQALDNGPVFAEADFFPEWPAQKFDGVLRERARAFSGRPFSHFACGLLNDKILKAAAELAVIDWRATLPGIEKVVKFGGILKCFRLEITGATGFEDAMVTTGGCTLDEIDPSTFASKKVKGLYVTGELLDIDGDSGGYNLHLAWTSGILAGRHAAHSG
ncbi:MAG: aminoacetone oxidase family FAD-binding enzyme [Elusimicrobia bacterium]|nr:aminoacetone oxidase family FAD-binding enzyme [Elusimicrobiota bacterium]